MNERTQSLTESHQPVALADWPQADAAAGAADAQAVATPPDADAATAETLLQAEAVLFIATEPLDYATLARALDLPAEAMPGVVAALRARFAGRGIRVQELAGHLQLVSAPEAGPTLERFLGGAQPNRLSAAALEVLAIVAYRQPLTRAQVEAIRGVDSSGVMRSLLARDLIHEVGRADSLGRPILYATSPQFLHLFGIESLDDLPPFVHERMDLAASSQ
jgi:segregation and condensation protein B